MNWREMIEWLKVYWPPLVTVALGGALSVMVFLQLRAQDQQTLNEQFTRVATEQSKRLQWNITNYQNALHSAVDLFSSARRVELETFQRIARVIQNRYPEALALEWLPKVTEENREKFVSTMEEQYGSPFSIREYDSQQEELVPVQERRVYYPVTFQSPPGRPVKSDRILGFDHYSLRPRRMAITEARDRGSVTVIPTTVLPWEGDQARTTQVPDNNLGITFYKPVFGSLETTGPIDANPEQPVGMIALNLRVQSIISPVFEGESLRHNVAVYEHLGNKGDSRRRLIYTSPSVEKLSGDQNIDANIAYREQFPVSNGAWTVVIWPQEEYLDARRSWAPLLALGFGLLLTAGFTQGVIWFSRRLVGRREQFRSVVDSAEDAILSVDAGGEIVLWNDAAEEIFGYEEDEIIGTGISKLIARDQRKVVRDAFNSDETPDASDLRGTRELRGIRRDDVEFPLEFTLSSWDEQGETYHTVIIRDLTERKRREKELRELNEDLEKKVDHRTKELEEFVYAASHDLREPARVMETYAGFLESDLGDSLDEPVRKDLEFIRESANQMNELIDSLLKLSRIGQDELHLETVSIEECVTEALEQQKQLMEEVQPEIKREELPEITADPSLVRDLYKNLIGNALKYGIPEDETPILTFTARRNGDDWILGVRDNGPGIDTDFQEEIFEPFKYLRNDEDTDGTGIGLSICRRIVDRHGGRIWVESPPDEGAHFRFTLPTNT